MIKNNKSKADEAYYQIKKMMFQRKIKPSQRLIYKDLAEILQMSHIPIINALNRLEEQGFLISMAFRGYQVRTLTAQDANDLYEAREALESYIVELVIKKADDKNLTKLIETHDQTCCMSY